MNYENCTSPPNKFNKFQENCQTALIGTAIFGTEKQLAL